MAEGRGAGDDAKDLAQGGIQALKGAAEIESGNVVKGAIDAAQGINKAKGPALKIVGTCCAVELIGAIFVGLLFINVISGGATEQTSTVSDTTQVGGTSGAELANADALTLDQITTLLKNEGRRGENMLPYAQQIYDSAHKFNINPLFAIAMYVHESSLGTAGAGKTCRNPGNISHRSDDYSSSGITGLGNCNAVYGGSSRWEGFSTYGDGVQAQMWLLRVNYLDKGQTTLEEIIHKYAPSSDGNNESAYVSFIKSYMSEHSGGN